MALPFDRYRCRGCSQLLEFDKDARVPDATLRACEGRCNWVLLDRPGVTDRPAEPAPRTSP